MKNIFKIFHTDLKRLCTNVVAVVVIMGLCVIPSLYGWFNILSNWDPYGEDATSNMEIAVFSEDQGIEIEGMSLNVGENVISGLKENTTIGWIFTDTAEEATDGVYSGKYYAALVIPEDFTEDMISFLTGDIEHARIEYYENEKKNAIAPKITSKAQKAVTEEVNATFISTLAEVTMEISGTLSGSDDEGSSIVDVVLNRMNELDGDLGTYITMLNSFINITDSASSLLDTTQVMLPNIDSMVDTSQSTVTSLESALVAADGSAAAATQLLSASLDTVEDTLNGLYSSVDAELRLLINTTVAPSSNLGNLAAVVDQLSNVLTTYQSSFNTQVTDLTAQQQYQTVITDLNTLSTDLKSIDTTVEKTQDDITALSNKILNEINSCVSSVQALKDTYNYTVKPQIDTTINDMQTSMIATADVLNSIDSNFSEVAVVLQQYEDTLKDGNTNLVDSRDMAQQMKDALEEYIAFVVDLSTDEQYSEIVEMLQTDPSLLGSFLSSPVSMETVAVYEIDTYGSAMAPFYTILAIWVGALILVAIIHVKVHPVEGLEKVRHYQEFFGRYLTFFLIGQIQTLITVLGNLLFIGIQCLHPFLFWLACSFSSFVFTIMIYSLTVAFGNVGEALAVVIMVIQVAGAGGTFPVEVLPEVYQAVYKYLPFTYGMKAMKECIGGMYQMDYWKALLALAVFAVISLAIGLVLAIPFKRLNKKIEESKERSRVMI